MRLTRLITSPLREPCFAYLTRSSTRRTDSTTSASLRIFRTSLAAEVGPADGWRSQKRMPLAQLSVEIRVFCSEPF
jgi:hypothetical protein